MKLPILLLPLLALPALAGKTEQLTSSNQVPQGLQQSDWQSIRAAHEAWQHGFRKVDGVWQARNPSQCWTTTFDGRGFLANPHEAAWSWGLELRSYGFASSPQPVSGTPEITASGQSLSYHWQGGLEEWFVNDGRGLEHGFIVPERPQGAVSGEPLVFTLATVGDLQPSVSSDAQTVHFRDSGGAPILNYSGLKVWDANGSILASRFEQGNDGQFRIAVEEDGARYPLTIDPIAQQAFLKASNTQAGDFFGYSVAVSGDSVVVGAPYEGSSTTGVNTTPNENASSSGAAYVFVRSGSTWSQQAYLKASNSEARDYFGTSVAISGDTVVVGAYSEDSSTTGVNSTPNESAANSGAAYVFVRNGTVWSQQAYLKASNSGSDDEFGVSVAVSGDAIVVGARGEDSSTTGVNSTPNENASSSGAAYVFVRSGSTWSQQAYLKASNTGAFDWFGESVAIAGDAIVVGAWGQDSNTTGVNGTDNGFAGNSGAAYVFVRSGTTWSQQAYLKASNTGASDYFGDSVAIAGDTIVVGAYGEDSSTTGINNASDDNVTNSGAAYVFVRSGTIWSQQAYLKASNTGGGDRFGDSVAIAGDTVVVGAPKEDSSTTGVNSTSDDNGTDSGAAYVFVRSGTIWSQQAYLKASNTGGYDEFGFSVAVWGDTVVVGAPVEGSSTTGVNSTPNDDAYQSGAAYIFDNFIAEPEIVVEQPAGSNLVDGVASVGFGSGSVGTTVDTKSFVIRNTGSATLSGLAISSAGSHPGDFVLGSLSATSLEPGASLTFTVAFSPTTAGSRNAVLQIASNDADESPFDITLTGDGTGPEIAVEQPLATEILDGGTKSFGSVLVGSNTSLTFTIRNTGSSNLTGLTLTKDGVNAADFTISANPVAPVAPGGTTTFIVKFQPRSPGDRTAAIHILNNDTDEAPYDITLTGSGIAPEMDVLGNNVSIPDNDSSPVLADHTDFGPMTVSSGTVVRTFTIKNFGTAPLSLNGSTRVVIGGASAADFVVTTLPAASVAVGGSTTFQVTFNPRAAGIRTATLSIASNDANENPYNFAIQGTGTAPEMDVLGNNVSIPDNDTSPTLADHTDFGSKNTSKGTVVRTFTIKNTGTAALNLTGTPRIVVGGANAADFKVTSLPAASVAVGGTTKFQVTFNPSSTGLRTATLSIPNNDENENPYNFKIKGTGLASAAALTAAPAALSSTMPAGVKTSSAVEMSNHLKYLSLTVYKPAGVLDFKCVVEVSGNLTDWFSGPNHTTILQDDARILRVRDNTPLTQDSKRYIRLKPSPR